MRGAVALQILANGDRADAVERRMGSTAWAPLAAYLGFRIVYANGRTWRPEAKPRVPAQAWRSDQLSRAGST